MGYDEYEHQNYITFSHAILLLHVNSAHVVDRTARSGSIVHASGMGPTAYVQRSSEPHPNLE